MEIFGVILIVGMLALPIAYLWLMWHVGVEIAVGRDRDVAWAIVPLLLGPLGLAIIYMLPPVVRLPKSEA